MFASLRTLIEAAVFAAMAALIWYVATPKHAPTAKWQAAQVAPEVKLVPTVTVAAPKGVVVYAAIAKRKLNLPPAIQANKNDAVIAAVQVEPDYRPETVAVVFDKATGKSIEVIRQDKYPLFAAEQTGEAWLGVGYSRGQRVGVVTVYEDLVQIKALHFGVAASAMSDGTTFAGVTAGIKW